MRTIIPKDAVLIPEQAKKVFEGEIYDVYQWQQKMFDGSFETFERLKRPDSVQIIVLNENKILVQEQQQPNTDLFYSLPGGRHDVDEETELEGAKRELLEESGLVCQYWKLVDVYQPDTYLDRLVYTYVASQITEKKECHLDVGEKITDQWCSYEDFIKIKHHKRFALFNIRILGQITQFEDLLTLPEYKD